MCQTFVERATSRDSFWKEQYTDIATNSCTGEVKEFYGYEYTPQGDALFGLVLTAGIAAVVLVGLVAVTKWL